MRSDKLMRFPSLEPVPIRTKDAERERLLRDVQRFIDSGGQIRRCDVGATGYEHSRAKFVINGERA